ncbi:hypothetical protein RclHR1_03930015 [Rhizophagus clarus]|uniref:Protein kinase domain-containing protein n=1 Tax=Rhizophagus clarus TaxID=94130 RepID=A0A2Z6RR13_9GLOM|nr:hypothetical protein RclHR1_03930015 [Rhizophagus clarus]
MILVSYYLLSYSYNIYLWFNNQIRSLFKNTICCFSRFGKSENVNLDEFIKKNRLKWIPYDQFNNVEYLDKGGFGTIHKAVWSSINSEVALKCLNSLNENLDEFLNEWDCHVKCLGSGRIINLYGFTKDPDTLNYMMVMYYANKGNLRGNLTKIVGNNWGRKLIMLYKIISGLNKIHKENLVHCDFHDGNILKHEDKEDDDDEDGNNKDEIYISDLGLCQPVEFLKKYDIYGVIPFMAPEVLRGKSYTLASDIYSFSMIMWEFTSGVPPFNNRAHDLQLSLSICKGERPEIIENIPRCYVDLMKKCWSEDPLERPSAKEVSNIIADWIFNPGISDGEISDDKISSKISKISKELKSNVMEFINAPTGNNNPITEFHPQACYKSHLLDFTSKKLNEILESECLNYVVNDNKPSENEIVESECLNCIIDNIKSLDNETNKIN